MTTSLALLVMLSVASTAAVGPAVRVRTVSRESASICQLQPDRAPKAQALTVAPEACVAQFEPERRESLDGGALERSLNRQDRLSERAPGRSEAYRAAKSGFERSYEHVRAK